MDNFLTDESYLLIILKVKWASKEMFNYFLMTEGWQVRPLCDIDGKVILDKQRLLLDTYDKI